MAGWGYAQSLPSLKKKLFSAIDWDDDETRNRIIAEAMDGSKLQERSEKGENLIYVFDEQTPYTGWARHEIPDGIGGLTTLVRVIRVKDGKIGGAMLFRDNRRKLSAYNFKDGKTHGLSTEWYENGQKSLERNFKDGKQDGSWIQWHEDGTESLRATYEDDKQVGLSTEWYENGRKKSEINYKDGKVATVVVWKPNGEKCPITNVKGGNGVEAEYFEKQTEPNRFCWAFIYMDGKKISWRPRQVSWHENGQMRFVASFLGEKRDGQWIEWFENGQMRFQGNFKLGKKDGRWTEWHENGQCRFQGNFKGGQRDGLWTGWHENGQKHSEGNFKDDQNDGWWTEWSASGRKLMEGNFKDDNKDGPWTYWHENGRKQSEEIFRDGKLDGLSKGWDDEGRKETESNWNEGKMDGLVARWYENGQKEGEANFKEGKLWSVVAWKPDGEKCPVTNVVNGSGVWVLYEENGIEESRRYYLDGKKGFLASSLPAGFS